MKTIAKIEEKEIVINKSRFVTRLFPVKDKTELKKIIEEISTTHKDATHNCTAYILKKEEGSNDDGEPGGTAGRPMLNVLKMNELNYVLAIVTRYFGGIKLGAGGLVRAYSKSVQEALNLAEIIHLKQCLTYNLLFDYSNIKQVDDKIRENNIKIIQKDYHERVKYKIAVEQKLNEVKSIFKDLKEKISIEFLREEYLKLD
ncbi:YigZ family protein [Methanobrevibacter curvatus]|uniref:IMPACT family member YigZ n=1 Tax=Methanobrevibacter curvatus TaxID=49547 RepID=A0A166CIF6_9EURY|nr:YigZ family protein [Methanobrevibacter curvatus]KZX14542.1 IMPACT family member YigZ [Methanobrevibacter curvatus]